MIGAQKPWSLTGSARAARRGLFHAGRAGQGNNWACGNDVAVCRAGRTAQRARGWARCG